jgi:hypothetical protein
MMSQMSPFVNSRRHAPVRINTVNVVGLRYFLLGEQYYKYMNKLLFVLLLLALRKLMK